MSKMPLRDLIIGILQDIGAPTDRRALAEYASALAQRKVTAGQIGGLIPRERTAFVSGERREVWLCHPQADAMEVGDVAYGVLALSTWMVEERTWHGYSARTSAFRVALSLTRAVERVQTEGRPQALALQRVARAAAMAIAGMKIPYDTFDPDMVRTALERCITREAVAFELADEAGRRIAGRLVEAHMSQEDVLFGKPRDLEPDVES